MSWEASLKLVELSLIILQALFLLFMFLMNSKYAKKEDVAVVGSRADAAHHRIDLLTKDLEALPTHETVKELRAGIGDLKEGQATGRATMQGLGREIGQLRESWQRTDEFLRTNR